jgi:hypothetical protein
VSGNVPARRPSQGAGAVPTGRPPGAADEVLRDPHSWDLFIQGYSAGTQHGATAGYEDGYADADQVLRRSVAGFLERRPMREVIRAMDARAYREKQLQRPVDQRSPDQVRAEAATSWGLSTSHDPHHTNADQAATRQEPDAADLADDDDWAWG